MLLEEQGRRLWRMLRNFHLQNRWDPLLRTSPPLLSNLQEDLRQAALIARQADLKSIGHAWRMSLMNGKLAWTIVK